jgi:acetolactate synthase regulatory subunit
MHRLTFVTDSPADHCPRLLDIVRRMGFRLVCLSVILNRDEEYDVTIDFLLYGDLSPCTLASRVGNLFGVKGLALSQVPARAGRPAGWPDCDAARFDAARPTAAMISG